MSNTIEPEESDSESAASEVISEEMLKDLVEKAAETRNAELFLKQGATGRVLFCPGCLCDWNLVTRLSDVVRVFIFCSDAGENKAADALSLHNCPEQLRKLFSNNADGGDLKKRDQFGAPSLGGIGGHYARFTRIIEVEGKPILSRDLLAVSLNADPATAYYSLFEVSKVAPAYVSVLHAGWEGAMKQVLLQAGQSAPQNLIADWPGAYGPWNWLWRELRSWGKTAVFKRRTDPPHPVIPLNQAEAVSFEATSLAPNTIGDADAVVLSPEEFLRYYWLPERLRIFINSPDEGLIAELREYDRRVEALPLLGRPFREAAPALARACRGRTRNVHLSHLGFEDEAEGIWKGWAETCGGPRLVLHGRASDWASMSHPCPDLV